MITRENLQDIYTLSPLQEGMYFHALYNPSALTYFEQQSFRRHGNLNVAYVEKSLNELFKRYNILRSVFVQKTTERPLQVVLRERKVDLHYEDLTRREDKEAVLARYKAADRARFFDLGKDVLMRVAVFRLAEAVYEVVWSWHHILMDAWCVDILKQEFLTIYQCYAEGRPCVLPPCSQYKGYIEWLEKQDKEAARQYWTDYLAGYHAVSSIGGSQVQERTSREYQKRREALHFDADTTRRLTHLARRYHVTVNIMVQSLWGILLSKYNNTRDVVFGTVVTTRPSAVEGIESMLGLFINTLPVRVAYGEHTTFSGLLRQMQKNALRSEAASSTTLAEIQAASPLKRPLFDHILLFQNFRRAGSPAGKPRAGGADPLPDGVEVSHVETVEQYYYDFNVFALPGEKLSVLITYNEEVYDTAYVQAILRHLEHLTGQVAAQEDCLIDALTLLPPADRHLVQVAFNQTARVFPVEPFAALFEARLAVHADKVALVCNGREMTYRELNEKANRLAHYLRNTCRVRPNHLVGLMIERSDLMVIGLLGIIKSGGAFLPVDAGYPRERKRHLLRESGAAVLLTHSDHLLELDFYDGQLLALDVQLDGLDGSPDNPVAASGPDDLMYVIYTSGSTGSPKGVKIGNRSFTNYLHWANDYYCGNGSGFHFPLFTSLSFDLTLTSLFTTLLRGDRILIYGSGDVATTLQNVFDARTEANAVKLTPSHVNLLGSLPLRRTNVALVIVGGEALTREHVRVLQTLNPLVKIYNEYGPTEATVGCTVRRVDQDMGVLSVGKPIANAEIYVLNRHRQPQPVGVEGEIYIAGTCLAQGYLHDEVLTAKKFVTGADGLPTRVYATGDAGKWTPDGNLEFLGRKDHQVKLRGYRIELGEIESLLMRHPAVGEAVVRLDEATGNPYLAAYFTARAAIPDGELHQYLRQHLPEYCVPSRFIALDAIPLTINGKVDHKALPDAGTAVGAGGSRAYAPPRDAMEEKLCALWAELLGRDKIGIHDEFLEAGGHSLKAVQLASRILKEFDVKIEIKDVFEMQCVEQLARKIKASTVHVYEPIRPAAPAPHYELSHAQQRLWLSEQLQDNQLAYLIRHGYVFRGGLDRDALEKSFAGLLARHESLRTTFAVIDGVPRQVVRPPQYYPAAVPCLDLRECEDQASVVAALAAAEGETPFDLQAGPLLRMKLLRTADDEHIFLFTLHHIVSDAWSMGVLVREVLALYKAHCRHEKDSLPPLPIQYKDYAAWQHAQIQSEAGLGAYWRQKLAGNSPELNLPADFPGTEKRAYTGAFLRLVIGEALKRELDAVSKAHRTSAFTVMVALLKALFYRHSGQDDITLGTVVSGRNHPDLENQIGFYVNTLPLRTQFSKHDSFDRLIARVNETITGAFAHQLYPFDRLVEDLCPRRDRSQSPLFESIISYRDAEPAEAAGEMQDIAVSEYSIARKAPAYDLVAEVVRGSGSLLITFTYNQERFRETTVRSWLDRLELLMRAVASNSGTCIGDVDLSALTVQADTEESFAPSFSLHL